MTLALPLLFLLVMGGVFGNNPGPRYYRGAGALDYDMPAYCGLVWAAVGLLALPVMLSGAGPAPGGPWSLTDTAIVAAFTLGAAFSAVRQRRRGLVATARPGSDRRRQCRH